MLFELWMSKVGGEKLKVLVSTLAAVDDRILLPQLFKYAGSQPLIDQVIGYFAKVCRAIVGPGEGFPSHFADQLIKL